MCGVLAVGLPIAAVSAASSAMRGVAMFSVVVAGLGCL